MGTDRHRLTTMLNLFPNYFPFGLAMGIADT